MYMYMYTVMSGSHPIHPPHIHFLATCVPLKSPCHRPCACNSLQNWASVVLSGDFVVGLGMCTVRVAQSVAQLPLLPYTCSLQLRE